MMSAPRSLMAVLFLLAVAAAPLCAEEAKPAGAEKYLLRYKFKPEETIRWQVVHRAKIVTTVSGTTQTAETVSSSVKVWRVTAVDDQGRATFENSVENVDMSQKLTGRAEVRYNSQKDKSPPLGFENIAASVGVPLSVVTLDNRGTTVRREQKDVKAAAQSDGLITIPLPQEPVAVGETWALPFDAEVPLPNGTVKKVKTQQKYVLKQVTDGVAEIEVATQILTPIHDPAIEAMLVQRESHGTLRFDIDAGRVIGQQMDLDRRVVGFRGEASSLHYLTQFTEELLAGDTAEKKAETASRPAGVQ
jgi:hypothetical protein